MNWLLVTLAVAPSLVWMYWIWRRDKYDREPLRLVLWLLFGGGILSVVGTFILIAPIEDLVPAEEAAPIINMFFTAAAPEELAKLLPVLLFAWRSRHWDEPFDGIVYAGATALGFNLIETAGYMLEEEALGGALFQGIVRGTLGGHMVYGIVMGFFLSRARFSTGPRRWGNMFLAWAVPTALHTAWNAALTYGGDIIDGVEVAGLVAWGLSTALWVLAFECIRRSREVSLAAVDPGTVQLAKAPCPGCEGAYPTYANFCQTCGAPVQPLPASQ